jgi:hypothetical protein
VSESIPTFYPILRCSSKQGMVATLAKAEINYAKYLDNKEADIFVWLEFTCDVDSKWVDHWLDYWSKWLSKYYQDPTNHLGLITNIGMREPFKHNWNRVKRLMVDNTMQALLYYHQANNHPTNPQVSEPNGRMLFLTGKPLSINRMPVLDLIDQGPLSAQTTASLFWNDSLFHIVEQVGINRTRAEHLVQKYIGSPDNLKINNSSLSGHFHSAGMPYDPRIYSAHQLSLIPETTVSASHMYNYCTEKTYRTMLNLHPFIILGQPGTVDHLRNRGYRTFTEYLPVPNYNDLDISTVEKLKQHWPSIEANCLALLDTKHWSDIQQDCVHNHNRLLEENQQMIDLVTRESHGQIIYDLESYNKFNWGMQPDHINWPIALPGNH